MQDTYSTLLALLQEQPLKLQRLRAFRKSFRCDAPATMSGSLTALNALNRRLGGGDACLLVCTSLNSWLDDLEETAKDEMICVRIGLVSPSKKEVYDDFLMETNASGVSSIIVNPAYLGTNAFLERAIVVAYHSSPCALTVPITSILPLGIPIKK